MFSYAGITQVRFKGFVLSPRRPFKIERAPLTTYTASYITTSTQKSQEKDSLFGLLGLADWVVRVFPTPRLAIHRPIFHTMASKKKRAQSNV